VILSSLWLAACSNLVSSRPAPAEPTAPPVPVQPAQPEPAPEEPAPLPLSKATQAELRYLLDEADRAIRNDHLSDPAKGSALALYEEVMTLDPDNETARRGLERIVERYLELAIAASEAGRFDEATLMLDRARLVDAAHPGIDPVAARVHLLSSAERRVIALNGQQLRDRDPAVEETLRQAGVASQQAWQSARRPR
jgi:hypothetical protein